jgi:hypothetical protein
MPEPFKIERSFPVYVSPKTVERRVHFALSGCRANNTREFFMTSVEDAVLVVYTMKTTVILKQLGAALSQHFPSVRAPCDQNEKC